MVAIEANILRLLGQYKNGLTKEGLRRRGVSRSLSEIVTCLEKLEQERVVQLGPFSKWRLTNPLPTPTGPLPTRSAPEHWEARPSLQRVTGVGEHERVKDARPHDRFSSRWTNLRRLCSYYETCVRLEERPNLTADAGKPGVAYVEIDRPIDWQSVAAGREITLFMNEDLRQLIRRCRKGRRGPRMFIGSPVDIKTIRSSDRKEKTRLASPVFTVLVEYRVDAGRITLAPQYVVDVNHGWLEKGPCRNSMDVQQEFLESVGLREDDRYEEEDGESEFPRRPPVSNLAELCRLLLREYPAWWREPGSTSQTRTEPPLADVDRDGLYNRVILMPEPRLKYSRGLIAELSYIAKKAEDDDIDRSALPLLFSPDAQVVRPSGEQTGAEDASSDAGIAEFKLLNDEQRGAVARGLVSPLTVVTGPPGTGKSLVVSHVMSNMALARRSVLFASRNHQAIAAVEPRLNAIVEPEIIAIRPSRPHGESSSEQFGWVKLITELLTRPRSASESEAYESSSGKLRQLMEERKALEDEILEQVQLGHQLAKIEQDLRLRLVRYGSDVEDKIRSCPSLEESSSYLRLARALDSDFESRNVISRTFRCLIRFFFMRPLIRRAAGRDRAAAEMLDEPPVKLMGRRREDARRLASALRRWADLSDGAVLAARGKAIEDDLRDRRNWSDLQESLGRLQTLFQSQTRTTLRCLAEKAGEELSPSDTQEFASILGALKISGDTANPERQSKALTRALRSKLESLLDSYHLWAVTNLSARSALPMKPGCFDLLVVDEASQCDIASVVPLLFRARRLMVVGDPLQLPPVFKLRRQAEREIRSRLGLDDPLEWGRYLHSVNSFYGLASTSARLDRTKDVVALADHYRCHDSIAGYCNSTFYRKTLRHRTNRDGLVFPSKNGRSLEGCLWTHISGRTVSAAQGCYSPPQIEQIVGELSRLRDEKFPGTIGVVTPFRIQANRIRDAVYNEIDPQWLASRQFLVDTADGFQGDERDVILFSLVGSPGMPEGSLWFYRSNKNRFNVAASRARALLHIFGDEEWAETCGIPYIRRLLDTCRRAQKLAPGAAELIGPVWEPRLAEELRAARIPFEQQYPACGYYLDFAVLMDGLKLDVEVDGETYHRDPDTGLRRSEDVYRDFQLTAAGWRVQRFWVYELREDMEACIERIRKHLRSR